jgi:hypothetical protein
MKSMTFDITPCQIRSEIVNLLAAIAGSIGQLEGVNLIQPGPQLRHQNRILMLYHPVFEFFAGGASYP